MDITKSFKNLGLANLSKINTRKYKALMTGLISTIQYQRHTRRLQKQEMNLNQVKNIQNLFQP